MRSGKPTWTAARKERDALRETTREKERDRDEEFENRILILGVLSALFAAVAFGGIATIHYDAYRLSAHGVGVNADARFLGEYVDRRRKRFRYELSFEGYVWTKELFEPFAGSKVDVVYDPSNPRRWAFGKAGASFLTNLESVLDGDWATEVILFGFAAFPTLMVVVLFRSRRRAVRS
jgi:hypothetical protein